MFTFTCPHCQATLSTDPARIGQPATCGKCQQQVTVPQPPVAKITHKPTESEVRFPGCLFALWLTSLLVSIVFTLFYWNMNTYVWTARFEQVHKLELMNDRLVGAIIGVGWINANLFIAMALIVWLKKNRH